MLAALLHRCDPTRYPAPAAAHEWLGGPLVDLGRRVREVTGRFGDDPFAVGTSAVVTGMLSAGSRQWHPLTRGDGFQASTDFAGLLDRMVRTLFLDAYTEAPRTFAAWTRAVTVDDFGPTLLLNPGFPALLEVPEDAEYTRHWPAGPTAALHVLTYGRVIALTRHA